MIERIYVQIEILNENMEFIPQTNTAYIINDITLIKELKNTYYKKQSLWEKSQKENILNIKITLERFYNKFNNNVILQNIENNINLNRYKDRENTYLSIDIPLPKTHLLQVLISKIDGYYNEDSVHIPYFQPIEKNTYSINDISIKANELIALCKNKDSLKTSHCDIEWNFIPYDIVSFDYDVFLKEFKDYSDFKQLCDSIKINDYETKQNSITIDFYIRKNSL